MYDETQHLMTVIYAFLNHWDYFTSAYYVKLLYGQLSSLSVFRTIWYKIKDSELRGICLLTHGLYFSQSLVGQLLCFYIQFHLKVVTGLNQKIIFC